jgi:hypothetical protein
MPCGSVFGRFLYLNLWESMDTTKFNLLPNERLESFWDALRLSIRTFLCFKIVRNGMKLFAFIFPACYRIRFGRLPPAGCPVNLGQPWSTLVNLCTAVAT